MSVAPQFMAPRAPRGLQHSWETAYRGHRRKVLNARPLVDTHAPPPRGHLLLKLKKLKLEEERLSAIHRDNCLLLERLACILRSPGTRTPHTM
ncbi:uncharacterized protein CFAP97D2 [Erinaceus europaeus]|uniref:Uncharacterized protein CFAP97D2 n=1 Tax=Erinaceus europaeus TaxID=9365 RepID=A0ABM3WSZ8_ERIEU|nr:uncharacterized protein CFAP97D2 [Erinaceus europaeus]